MKVGFTGTREGMRPAQADAVANLLLGLGVTELHHGDCEGADEEFHGIASTWRSVHSFASDFKDTPKPRIVIHPPDNEGLRAFCDPDEFRPRKPYHERNRDIVDETDVLIAAPKQTIEPSKPRAGGTWYTVRYARQLGRSIYLVLPNGIVMRENVGVMKV